MTYFLYFFLAFALSVLITPVIRQLALRFKVIDLPGDSRKIHSRPTPLLGGLAIYISLFVAVCAYLTYGVPDTRIVPMKFFLGILIGGAVLIAGGALDDKLNLPPKLLWLFPALASLIVVFSGIGVGITKLTNPFGSPISLHYTLTLLAFHISVSAIFIWLWMMGMIFTTKLLDGLDGLCAGIALIGGLTMFAISLGPKVNQPITAELSIIFSGTLIGYLFYAFNPASIFLGEGGSTLLGFTLGVLSVILGAKIATALLVMGIPILDVAWVIIRRMWYRNSPFKGDRQHLHFRLLDIGLSQKQAVLVLFGISAIFGVTAVFLQSLGKLVALIILFLVMLVLAISTVILYKRQHPHIPDLFDYGQTKTVDPVKK